MVSKAIISVVVVVIIIVVLVVVVVVVVVAAAVGVAFLRVSQMGSCLPATEGWGL